MSSTQSWSHIHGYTLQLKFPIEGPIHDTSGLSYQTIRIALNLDEVARPRLDLRICRVESVACGPALGLHATLFANGRC
jgi:hypothetical protein